MIFMRAAPLVPMAAATCSGAFAQQTHELVLEDDGQLVMPAKDCAVSRFSKLTEVNTGNVRRLQVAWMFSTGLTRGHEPAPLMVGSTIYPITPYPNYQYAIDLTQPGGCQLEWTYKPEPSRAAQGFAWWDVVNRGAAYGDGKIISNTRDNYTFAVDAQTGKKVWKIRLGDFNLGETKTMVPLTVKNKVLVANSCNSGGELGMRGWLACLNVHPSKLARHAYCTGPDKDALIEPDFKAPYDSGHGLGVTTWQGEQWMVGGGTVWGWITYDPDSNLVYCGSGNPGPWNPLRHPGDNKWTSSVFARDADTGAAMWAVQDNPHDLHDYDGINESVLVDVTVGGKQRKAMLHPDRSGYMYLTDRLSDEIISAQPCVSSHSALDVNLRTGRPVLNPDKAPPVGAKVSDICPAAPGGKDWQLTPASIWKLVAYVRTPSRSAADPVGAAPTDKQPGKP
jgi:PQQ-dependent dehydrogenase (methanol/ethanol family)